jgi:hypothetical protein
MLCGVVKLRRVKGTQRTLCAKIRRLFLSKKNTWEMAHLDPCARLAPDLLSSLGDTLAVFMAKQILMGTPVTKGSWFTATNRVPLVVALVMTESKWSACGAMAGLVRRFSGHPLHTSV